MARKAKADSQKTTKRWWWSKPVRAGLVCLVVVGLVGTFMYYNRQPSVGTISDAPADQPQVAAAETTLVHYTGSSFGFDYPSDYGNTQTAAPSSAISEQVSMVAHTQGQDSRKLAWTLKPLAAGAMVEDSGYRLRQNSGEYTQTTAAAAGRTATVFTKKDNTEITYFFAGPSAYISISGTTTNPTTDRLTSDMQAVTGSFVWQK